ncbi:MAG: 50S ribosomal protein L17, partial [Chloroflexota bacterium]
GIGPKISSVLNDAGVQTFAQLAEMTPEALRQILDDAGLSAINDPTTWPEQAALAAAGDWAALEKMQDDLKGGRR